MIVDKLVGQNIYNIFWSVFST